MDTTIRALSEGAIDAEPWFLRPKDGERLTGLSVKTIYAAIYSGALPAMKFRGRGWLIRREDLIAWVESESTPSVAA